MKMPIWTALAAHRGRVSRRALFALPAALAVAPPAVAAKRSRRAEANFPAKPAPLPERPAFTAQEQHNAEIPGFADVRFSAGSEQDYERAVPSQPGPWLVLTTGAEDGAYGAGFLNGWTESGERPDFSVVTGVSSGAMIAVYAFLGRRYDGALREAYTNVDATDIFEISATPESMVDSWPLKRLIDKKITSDLLGAVAAEHQRGRRLFVITTNLDAGHATVWNMGLIAARGGPQAVMLFRKVVLASASIPGAFPPVFIDVEARGHRFQEMHVDGGVNGPMYVAPESVLLSPNGSRLPASELYVIVNGKLESEFALTGRTIADIVGRSFSLALKLGARTALYLFSQAARRDGIGMKVTMVDAAFDRQERGVFDPRYMKALFEFGVERGRQCQFRTS
jgi:hypothetical protein